MGGETCSGHWLYAFLRRDPASGQSFLCLANFHPTETLADVRVVIPEHALAWLGAADARVLRFSARLGGGGTYSASLGELPVTGFPAGDVEPFGVRFFVLG